MAGATTAELQSRYQRQLDARALGEAATWIGENVLANWDATKTYFACKWRDLDPPPTTMMTFGPRGDAIEFDLPRIPGNPYEVEVHDWDAELRLLLHDWKWNRTEIRWIAPGHHVAVGKIIEIVDERPAKKMLRVKFNFRSLFFYNVSATSSSHLNYEPWLSITDQANQGFLYGELMAVT